MRALVTGAAGFIGSHLCEHLLAAGDEVVGVDAFTDYYPRWVKEENLAPLLGFEGFAFREGDLRHMQLEPLLEETGVIYHLAGQPGVRASWGSDFTRYVQHNVFATQRLLEACRSQRPEKLVFASSSSIYGDAVSHPVSESARPQPISPYGVTKLAAEHLCEVYRVNFGVEIASLRLFTVYGPRQRPDMAFSRLVSCALDGAEFELWGDGEQRRDCTYVGDVVRAMRDAATSEWSGVANIGGGQQVSLNQAADLVAEICGPLSLLRRPPSAGDVRHTSADTSIARAAFGYDPRTRLRDGLEAMVEWERSRAVTA